MKLELKKPMLELKKRVEPTQKAYAKTNALAKKLL